MKKILVTLGVMAVLMGGCRQTEKTEAVVSEIEAAQMEGRNAAKGMLDRDWSDTLKRAEAYHAVDSVARKNYADPQAAEAYRSSFRSTIETLHPETKETTR